MIDNSTRDTIDGWVYGSGSGGYLSPTSQSAPNAATATTSAPQPGLMTMATAAPATSSATPPNVYGSVQTQPQQQSTWGSLAASTIKPTDLTQRTVDPAKETVNGQMQSLMDANSPLLQQAKSDAMRTANERGLLNSTMAASAGTDAMLRSALNIATPDAAYYSHAADYNAAAQNQATMYNADQQNATTKMKAQMAADEATRAQQMYVAQMQDSTSRYNTDAGYRQQMEANKKTLVNNLLQNPDISPDRKAALLEQLGEGKSAGRNPDGSYTPGSGLAGAVYVIDSVAQDLRAGSTAPTNYANEYNP